MFFLFKTKPRIPIKKSNNERFMCFICFYLFYSLKGILKTPRPTRLTVGGNQSAEIEIEIEIGIHPPPRIPQGKN